MSDRELAVTEIQRFIRNISLINDEIPLLVSNGIYCDKTAEAVQKFQQMHGMEQTGEVDFQTWKKLVEQSKKSKYEVAQPVQVLKITNDDLPLIRGFNNEFVKKLKIMLNKVSNQSDEISKLDEDTFFDELTEKMVKAWQKIIRTNPNGVVDKFTWNMLSDFYLI